MNPVYAFLLIIIRYWFLKTLPSNLDKCACDTPKALAAARSDLYIVDVLVKVSKTSTLNPGLGSFTRLSLAVRINALASSVCLLPKKVLLNPVCRLLISFRTSSDRSLPIIALEIFSFPLSV